MNKVVAIVVTYNRKDLLITCLNKLKDQSESLDILVVDNASSDGTGDIFNSSPKNILYFNTGKNLGGAGGFCFGINKAVELGYQYLWILDDDSFPEKNALRAFLRKDKELSGNYGFLTSKVLWKDNSICKMNIQKISKWRCLSNFNEDRRVQYASFVSLFIKTETVKKFGLPFKEFFIWSDDWEYTRRISKCQNCYFVNNSIVHHFCNSNVGANIVESDPDRMDRFKFMYRNDVVLYRMDGLEGVLYLLIRNLWHCVNILKSHNRAFYKIKLICNSTIDGIFFRPVIQYPKKN